MPAPPNPRTQPTGHGRLDVVPWRGGIQSTFAFGNALVCPNPSPACPWEGCTKLGAITSGNPSFGAFRHRYLHTQRTTQKRREDLEPRAASYCPSWARTRTLLIQSHSQAHRRSLTLFAYLFPSSDLLAL